MNKMYIVVVMKRPIFTAHDVIDVIEDLISHVLQGFSLYIPVSSIQSAKREYGGSDTRIQLLEVFLNGGTKGHNSTISII